MSAVVRHRQGRLRALRRGRARSLRALQHKGFRVFADLKLHDIPTTVERGARAIGRHGVEFLNFHAAGGEDDVARRASTVCATARATRDTRDRSRSRSRCSRATRTSTRSSAHASPPRTRGATASCAAGTDVEIARAHGAAHDGARHPARRWRRARSGACRHARRRDHARRRLARDRPRRDRRRRPGTTRPKRLRATSPPRSSAHRADRLHEKVPLRILSAAVVPEVAGCRCPLRSPPSSVKPHSRRRRKPAVNARR